MAIDQSEIRFGSGEISYDAAQVLGGLIVEACEAELQDGYTEIAAWTQRLKFKDGDDDAIDAVYKEYLGFPADAVDATVAYKLVQVREKVDEEYISVLEPEVVLQAQVPAKDNELVDFIVTKKLGEDFPDDDGWGHEYLLRALIDPVLGESASSDE